MGYQPNGVTSHNRRSRIHILGYTIFVCVVAIVALLSYARLTSAAPSIPYKMNFQGRLTNSAGNIMADGLYNMQFRIYDTSTAGTLLWNETRETTARVQVTNGLFSTQLGDVTSLPPAIFNNASARYFEITLATPATATCSTAACATYETPMTPRQPMASSAYAFNADQIDGIDGSSLARNDSANTFSSTNTFNGTSTFGNSVTISGANPFTVGTGTANFGGAMNVSGTVSAAALVGPSLDTATATQLNIGSANATSINLNQSTTLGAGKTLTVGTSSNGIILSNTGIVLSGTARGTKRIQLNAEYSGAVLDAGTGSNNTGSMTAGYNATNRMNFYKWTTTAGTNQTYDVVVQVPIPADFDGFASSTPINVSTFSSNLTNGIVSLELRDSTNTVIQNFVSITPTAINTWQTRNSGTVTGTYTAGDYLTLRIRMQSPNAGDVRIGNIVMDYRAKF